MADPAGIVKLPEDPTITVVLPVRNEAATIGASIASMQSQTVGDRLREILVIDGDSDDDTAAIVRRASEADARVRLLQHPDRITPAALNIGLAAATSDVIARMDGHAEADPDYLERGLEALRSSGAWSVGGRMLR